LATAISTLGLLALKEKRLALGTLLACLPALVNGWVSSFSSSLS